MYTNTFERSVIKYYVGYYSDKLSEHNLFQTSIDEKCFL